MVAAYQGVVGLVYYVTRRRFSYSCDISELHCATSVVSVDTIISWTDPEVATDLALSFQETMGCSFIW